MFNLFGNKPKVEEPVVGPQADERDLSDRLDTITLEGGAPLYHALLEDTPVVSRDQAQEAKQRVQFIMENYPDVIKDCAGKAPDEAKKILEQAERGAISQAA